MVDWREQEARNETIFRDLNEWTMDCNDANGLPGRLTDLYLCECSDGGCTQPISLSRAEYEGIRAEPIRFAIALNHENPELDRLVSENERFAIVDKIGGFAARLARSTDPRR